MLATNETSCEFLSDLCLGGLEESSLGWALVLEALMFSYAFVGLAIVCDDYLVMSLEQVSSISSIRIINIFYEKSAFTHKHFLSLPPSLQLPGMRKTSCTWGCCWCYFHGIWFSGT